MNEQNLNELNTHLEQKDSMNSTVGKKKNLINYLLVFVILLLFMGNAGAFYYIFKNSQNKKINQIINEEINNQESDTTTTEEIILKDDEILVEWFDWPVKQTGWDIFNHTVVQKILESDSEFQSLKLEVNNIINDFDVYKVGTITKEEYQGNDLYVILFLPVNDMAISGGTMLRVIKNNDDLIVLVNIQRNYQCFIKIIYC